MTEYRECLCDDCLSDVGIPPIAPCMECGCETRGDHG